MHLSAVLLPFCVQHQQGNARVRKNNWWAEQSRAKYKGRVEGRRTETRETREVRGFHESSVDVLNGTVQNCLVVWFLFHSFFLSFGVIGVSVYSVACDERGGKTMENQTRKRKKGKEGEKHKHEINNAQREREKERQGQPRRMLSAICSVFAPHS